MISMCDVVFVACLRVHTSHTHTHAHTRQQHRTILNTLNTLKIFLGLAAVETDPDSDEPSSVKAVSIYIDTYIHAYIHRYYAASEIHQHTTGANDKRR